MNSIRSHTPGSVSGIERREVEFSTLEELLAIQFVSLRKEGSKFFHQFSKFEDILIAEYDSGRAFQPVGYLEDPDSVDLPICRAVRHGDRFVLKVTPLAGCKKAYVYGATHV